MTKPMVKGQMPHPGVQLKGTEDTAVYRLSDESGRLLYVGMGRNPLNRWAAHADMHEWWPEVASFEVTWYPSRKEAADEERRALRHDGPLRNIHGTERHGLVTGAGVRRALGGRRNFSEVTAAQGERTDLPPKDGPEG